MPCEFLSEQLREATKRMAEEFGSTSEQTVAALQELAMLLVGQCKWREAEEVLRSLLHRAEAGLGFTHETTLQALGTYAGVQWQLELWDWVLALTILPTDQAVSPAMGWRSSTRTTFSAVEMHTASVTTPTSLKSRL